MNYVGETADQIIASLKDRFFYGLRRTDQGELFLGKMDQLGQGANAEIQINKPGDNSNDFDDFEEGSDFYEGRNVEHELVYSNLNYEQYRWADKNIWYYINSDGELVASVNKKHVYDDGSSSSGVE